MTSDLRDEAATAQAGSHVRPVAAEDIPAVSDLFRRTFRRSVRTRAVALEAYLERLFIAPLDRSPGIASLVHTRPDGAVNGFIGVLAMPFLVDGATRRAAFCGSLMVEDAARSPLTGARLLRAFMGGPQDLSLSETANAVSEGMWRRLRGTVLPGYSQEWVRVFRPLAFSAAASADRLPAATALRALAPPFDALARRVHPPLARLEPTTCAQEEIGDDAEFAALLQRFTADAAARPAWSDMDLATMIADARLKSRYGTMTCRAVVRGKTRIGLYVHHSKPGGIGHVLQIAAAPGRMQDVVDRLFASAAEEGLAGLRGRTRPALIDAMLTRGCYYGHRASTLAHARDPALLEPFLAGRAFLNGFAGESWTRLIGDDLSR